MTRHRPAASTLAAFVLTAGLAAGSATSQAASAETARPAMGAGVEAKPEDPRTETLARLSKRLEVDFQDQPARDVFEYIADVTGADLIVVYESDVNPEGIDPETAIDFRARNQPALTVLDRVIRNLNAALAPSSEYDWQMTVDGAYQVGPKDALDRDTRTVIYDVGELLFEVPNFNNAPDFDLQTSSGSGGTQSPFQGASGQDEDRLTAEERLNNLIDLITTVVEPDAWIVNGGTSSTITAYQSTLIVKAPDYVHRALGGYSFWPSSLQTKRFEDGRQETDIRPQRQRRGP
ncbi:MAG: hypothetical protein ACF8Q5_07560 [Phycisphaerales bacterium JB040]